MIRRDVAGQEENVALTREDNEPVVQLVCNYKGGKR